MVGRLPAKLLKSFRFYVIYYLLFWGLSVIWLIVNKYPGEISLIYLGSTITGIGLGMGAALTLALVMRVCPPGVEGFTFALMTSLFDFGYNAVGPKTVTYFAPLIGGLIPALFTLIPFGLFSLIFLRLMLKSLAEPQQ